MAPLISSIHQAYSSAIKKARAKTMCPAKFGCGRSEASAIGWTSIKTQSNVG
jgi:hypothetical protein